MGVQFVVFVERTQSEMWQVDTIALEEANSRGAPYHAPFGKLLYLRRPSSIDRVPLNRTHSRC